MITTQEVKEKIIPLLKQYGVQYAGVFGSVARGDAGEGSDVDILVKFLNSPTFAAYLNLEDKLKEVLGRDVDLVTEGAINKFLRPNIEKDLEIVYGQR